jgi:hypothetical protein
MSTASHPIGIDAADGYPTKSVEGSCSATSGADAVPILLLHVLQWTHRERDKPVALPVISYKLAFRGAEAGTKVSNLPTQLVSCPREWTMESIHMPSHASKPTN